MALRPLVFAAALASSSLVPALAQAEELPSYKSPVRSTSLGQPEAEPQRDTAEPGVEVPQPGRGSVAVGALLLGGGALTMLSAPKLAAANYTVDLWGPVLTLGGLSMASGALFLGLGLRRQKRYQAWLTTQTERPPPRGYGLAASGGVLIVGGGIVATLGTVGTMVGTLGWQDPSVGYAAIAVGASALVTGAVLTTLGVRRNQHFNTWRLRERHPVEIAPIVSPILGGAQLGLSGRF